MSFAFSNQAFSVASFDQLSFSFDGVAPAPSSDIIATFFRRRRR